MRNFSHNRQLSVGFISLGCAKNLVDSEVIADDLLRAGFKLAGTPEGSDILIINTCAFIADAKKEAIDAILNACALKQKGTPGLIIVAGCLPQRYRQELQSLFPDVDAFIGVDQVTGVASVIRRLLNGKKGRHGIIEITPNPRAVVNPPPDRLLFTGAPYAYLKIAEGCDHWCTYCTIPQIRGRYRSRPIAGIVKEAEAHLGRGIRELNLIAQDVTFYGHDLGGKNNLPNLLRQIGGIGGEFWIRLLYGHPDHVGDDLLAAMAEVPQVCRYLDLPIQHCSEKILRRMGRGGNEDKLRALFGRIREKMPDITLRTTCLVGFPGETDYDFRCLLNFIEATGFDHLGVFVFSEEEGTKAAELAQKVSRSLARQRKDMLMRCQQKIVARKLTETIGRIEEMFVEKPKGRTKHAWVARSRRQAPDIDNAVYLSDHAASCSLGMFVKARYVKVRGYDMVAEAVDSSLNNESGQ